MKASLILGLALATLTANAAFAADGSSRTIDRLHKDMSSVELRIADNGSEQTVDRLHKDMTKAEARLADNGSKQTVDRLHRSMSRFDLPPDRSLRRKAREKPGSMPGFPIFPSLSRWAHGPRQAALSRLRLR